MNILISGSTGLVGSELVPFLGAKGHTVTRLTRSKSGTESQLGVAQTFWNPNSKKIDASCVEGHDTVVHLAGENIAGIWTEEKKNKIRKSRVDGTGLLSKSIAALSKPPKVFVSASAIGFYGNRGEEILTEESDHGGGFLAEVCREWEAAAKPAVEKGIRVVYLRIGLVLTPKGGALKTMLIPFRMGLGGTIGSGKQFFSWVAIDDVIGAIYHAIISENLNGPVNVVAPNPVRNNQFTKTLGQVLYRPTLLPVPAFALRLLAGEMADEMLLASTRVEPQKLLTSGYKFSYPELEGALRHLLGRNS